MPTILTTRARNNATYIITATYTDEDSSAVTPNAGLNWSLQDTAGNTINSRSAVSIAAPSTSNDIVLSGDDLAATGVTDDGIRVFILDGTYDSDAGNDLPLDDEMWFVVENVQLPVSLADAKRHMRIDSSNTDHDVYVAQLISSARAYIEKIIRRKLLTQTVTEYLDSWPSDDFFILKNGNLISVTSIKYKDTDGDQSTWASSNYIVEIEEEPGRVVLGYGKSWPTATLYPSKPIATIYSCGYGASRGDVPASIRQAIQIMVADLFENRESTVIGAGFSAIKIDTIKTLLAPYILFGTGETP